MRLLAIAWCATFAAAAALSAAADDLFELTEISSRHRTVSAEIADVNGDGRPDLVQLVVNGIPPDDQRLARVFLQPADGGIAAEPDFEVELPLGSATYDLADLLPAPGLEIALLERRRLYIVSLAKPDGERTEWALPAGGTLAAGSDERGLERLPISFAELGSEKPRLLVPGIGELFVLEADGTLVAALEVGGRANYFVPRRGGISYSESDIQLFFDSPSFAVGEVNGDGRADVVSSTRHELRVFLQGEDGSFTNEPSRRVRLGLLSFEEHIRGSGGVTVEARDIDGDGYLDLLLGKVRGSLTSASARSAVHMNRDGQWKLDAPDIVFESESSVGTDSLVDLEGDGKLELLRLKIPFTVLELVEALLTREADVRLSIHRQDGEKVFDEEPWLARTIGIPFSFDTFRPRGFLPSLQVDLNGDGQLDFVTSGDGDVFEVYLGGGKWNYEERNAEQELRARGELRFGDLDADGLPDFLIYDPQAPAESLLVGRNKGNLPGTRPVMRSRDE